MKISEKFNLNLSQYELDFVDIDIEKDMPLFLDPYLLSIKSDRWSFEAHATLESFFHFIIDIILKDDIEKARSYLRFTEPREVCLGVSKESTNGKGLGSNEAIKIFDYIIKSEVVSKGIVDELEDFKIFVDNVGHDKISDLTINIIRKHLIDYTKTQCELYNIPTTMVATGQYWNPDIETWESNFKEMIVINGRPIILVPKSIVSRKAGHFFSSEQYARHFVLNYLVSHELRINSSLVKVKKLKNGKSKKYVTKKDTAKKYNAYSKQFLREFTEKHPEVFDDFKISGDSKVKSLTNQQLIEDHSIQLIEDITTKLIDNFQNIDKGKECADIFHNHILSCMNFLFYPSLTKPRKEMKMNKGRKRIDILYTNEAEKGYFLYLVDKLKIPSSYIFVECKNYTKEITNPEFDQLHGRFGINTSQIGFLVFRETQNYDLLLDRCRDYYKADKSLIIPLRDSYIITMLNEKKKYLFDQNLEYKHEGFLFEITEKILIG